MKSLFDNLFLKALSLILACLVWLFVMGEEHSVRSYSAKVEISRLPEGLVVLNEETQFIEIKVSGPRGILNRLSDEAFVASLDLAPYGRGELDVPIPPEAVQAPKGVTISRISPSSVRMQLDALVEKEIPLRPLVQGEPTPGYRVEEVTIDPSTLVVTGPETLLNKITEIPTTPINVSGLTGDATVEADVDFQRRLVSWPPLSIRAQVVVKPQIITRSLPVVVTIAGEPDEAFDVTGIEVEPATISVTGPQLVVESVAGVPTPEVSLAGVTKSFRRRLTLTAPAEELTFSEGNEVVVKAVVAEREIKRVLPVVVKLEGEPHNDYQMGEIQIIPRSARVGGRYRLVNGMKEVKTKPIPIAGIDKLFLYHTTLDLPKGVERIDATGDVTVIIPVSNKVIRRKVPVRAAFSDAPQRGLEVKAVEVKPKEVLLEGISKRLRELDGVPTALLTYPESAGQHTLSGARVLLPEGVKRAIPEKVTVTIDLAPPPTVRRQLPVRAMIVGDPAPGFRLQEVVLNPDRIEVSGPRRLVEELSEVVTEPISLGSLKDETTITARLVDLPKGVTAAGGDVRVTVRLRLED